jgi:anhydro-N-acetylmuramic acid kinase
MMYIGIMSGTSLDGVDVALVDLSSNLPQLRHTYFQAYPETLKQRLLALHHPEIGELNQACLIANELSQLYAQATLTLLKQSKIPANQIKAIGCHGQTIRHCPELGYTVQLGNAALLAELTRITVVSDFRSRDIAAGGQGAPLVPAFHHHVLRHSSVHRVIVNIGGISNLTRLSPNFPTLGFDCGPGNLLMDAWIRHHRGLPYDENGAWAASGKVIPALFEQLSAEKFFCLPPPKSSGRDLFNLSWLQNQLVGDENPADVQATLSALTVFAIAESISQYCPEAEEVYLCGGGAKNSNIINGLKKSLPRCRLALTDELGMGADWLEAIAFAWLAQQAISGQPANLPEATGASHPCILGAIYQA